MSVCLSGTCTYCHCHTYIFKNIDSLLFRIADQQVLDIHLLPLPALPVCQSTDQHLFDTYIFKNLNSLICRFDNQRILRIYLLPLPALPVCRSTDQRLFHTYIFKNLNSLLCQFANQRILRIYLLTVPALPVCRSTDQRLFHTYILNFRILCSADLPINRFWKYTYCHCQFCRSANRQINAFLTRTYSKIPCSADFSINTFLHTFMFENFNSLFCWCAGMTVCQSTNQCFLHTYMFENFKLFYCRSAATTFTACMPINRHWNLCW